MGQTITYPNGLVLTSTALTPQAILTEFQSITCTLLGIALSNPLANTAVRQTWQQVGAPAWLITEDVCFVRGVLEDNWYATIRDEGLVQGSGGTITRVREYTRVWRIFWSAWGPNCFDNMRAVQSGLLLEVSTEPLSLLNLFVVPDMGTPQYAPELQDGQWWQRTTLEAQFYEQVTENLTYPSVASVELIGYSANGQFVDVTVT